jgi:membrane protein implicated in regulation of membrane protease activity
VVDAAEPLPDTVPEVQREKAAAEMQRLRWGERQRQRIAALVGPDAAALDPLVKTLAMAHLVVSYMQIFAGDDSLGTVDTTHREIEQARRKELGEREGYTVEPSPGGRYRVTATGTFGKPRDRS